MAMSTPTFSSSSASTSFEAGGSAHAETLYSFNWLQAFFQMGTEDLERLIRQLGIKPMVDENDQRVFHQESVELLMRAVRLAESRENGAGLSQEQQEKLFSKLRQLYRDQGDSGAMSLQSRDAHTTPPAAVLNGATTHVGTTSLNGVTNGSGPVVDQMLERIATLKDTLHDVFQHQIQEIVLPVEKIGVELIRLREENISMQQRVLALESELAHLRDELDSFKPFQFGLYKKIPKQ
jgi:hypothetical protein